MGLDTSTDKPKPIAAGHVTLAAVALVAAMAVALLAPTSHIGVNFVTHELPGIEVSSPNWPVEERSALFEYGAIKLKDPRGEGNYLSVHWSDSDRIQPDDYIKVITDLAVLNRTAPLSAGMKASRFPCNPRPSTRW